MNYTDNYRPVKLADRKWSIERQRPDGTWHLLPMCYATERAAVESIAERLDYFRRHRPVVRPASVQSPTDTPEQIARAAIASYREYTERYGQSPDEATEAAVHEVLEGLAVDVEAERADRAAQPGPTPEEMREWPV